MFFDLDDIYIRELHKTDLNGNWYKWFNDEEVTKYQNKKIYPNSYEKQLEYFNQLTSTDTNIVMAIVDKKTNIHIGNIGLHNIDYIHRRCEIGIVIGEKNFLAKGYATKCVKIFSDYAFDVLNLNKIISIIMENNEASLSVFQKAHYIDEGIMKEYFYKNGNYINVIIMSKIKNKLNLS